jgi:hypothetical protein
MKKFLKNKNALSLVVAATILIAVSVAVSIAVGAWMGSQSVNYMEISEMSIIDLDFVVGDVSNGRIVAHVTNFGTSDVTVDRIRVNGQNAISWLSGTDDTVAPSNDETFTITHTVIAGSKYTVTLYTVDGTMVGSYTATA